MGGDPNNPLAAQQMFTEGRMRLQPNTRPEVNPAMLQLGMKMAGQQNSGLARYLQAATPVTRVGTQVNRYQAPQIGQSLAAIMAQRAAMNQYVQQPNYGLLADPYMGQGEGASVGSYGDDGGFGGGLNGGFGEGLGGGFDGGDGGYG